MKTLSISVDRDKRRKKAKLDMLIAMEQHIGDKSFDWEERYNSRYIIQWAREHGYGSTAVQKAVDWIGRKIRLAENKKEREKSRS